MAVSGDSANIPAFPISLGADGRVKIHAWATNRARSVVEQDIDAAVQRLLAGERFNLHCSGAQVHLVNEKLKVLKEPL